MEQAVMDAGINYLAVLVSAVAFFIIGAIWYGALFGKSFAAALNFSADEQQKAQKAFVRNLGIHFVCGFLVSYMMAHMLQFFENPTIMDGIHTGAGAWFGFALPLAWIMLVFERRPMATFWINNGNWLVSFVAVGAILAAWS